MSLYTTTIALDGDKRQIIVHWDDNDPNTHITAPVTVPAADLDESRLEHELGRMGFRIASAGSDNVGRGWAVVSRLHTDRPFYNPLDSSWYAYLPSDVKREIASKYPGSRVPGV
ncbi:hypothetical protein [Mycolicibacterium austroafricanum]|uniref:hypothetical protein n=1 Tax=Mycolicibacterium austroafricanum TaxID=39687 RepID=UPI00056B1E03|nr:hypothetical protein [Mycolicibacterium austroafricanum]